RSSCRHLHVTVLLTGSFLIFYPSTIQRVNVGQKESPLLTHRGPRRRRTCEPVRLFVFPPSLLLPVRCHAAASVGMAPTAQRSDLVVPHCQVSEVALDSQTRP